MSGADPDVRTLAEMLLAGPRGRRLLLEHACASEQSSVRDLRDDSFDTAVFLASSRLEPEKGTALAVIGEDVEDVELPVVTPAEAAARLAGVELAEPTPELLRQRLFDTVGAARYWQEPDGRDALAGTPEMREALRRVAHQVAGSAAATWWRAPLDARAQWAVRGEDAPRAPSDAPPASDVLQAARDFQLAEEATARRRRPGDPRALWTGEWWSRPPSGIPSSTGEWFDGSPVGVWLVEDDPGWERVEATGGDVRPGLAVLEIDTAEAWAELCRRFPLDQSAQKRHDWYRATGRTGRWVIPDWAGVAEQYDAVHLTVGAYLAAAGTAIPVDADTATVIAGWGPDETFWLTDGVTWRDGAVCWVQAEEGTDVVWVRDGVR